MHSIQTRAIGLLLAALMALTFGGWTPAPAEDPTDYIEVATVDELVAAIRPNIAVTLQPGAYDLATAATYGKDTGNPCCAWETASENGFELRISNADGLSIMGAGINETMLLAEDRYAGTGSLRFCGFSGSVQALLVAAAAGGTHQLR